MRLSLFFISIAVAHFVAADQTNCVNGPCGPGNDQCGAPFDQSSPQFHIRDLSCAENDPNGPFLDPNTGAVHHFYQDHLAEPQGGRGQGPDWGHVVSHDFVHWAHLPVALWNDQPYDNVAIYTGSATIVDGQPRIVYPGLCVKDDWASCDSGTNLAIAVPADESDVLLTNWTKPAYNPVVNNTQRDPSTAWQTSTGEWRLTTYDTSVYYSRDFIHWSVASGSSGFPFGECPSFFPLPGQASNGATHVHKVSKQEHRNDWMVVGKYESGGDGESGTWTPLGPTVCIDNGGHYYASKDFYDSKNDRRINWGWAVVPPASTQTLPRVLSWDDEIQRLLHTPIEELKQLRDQTLVDIHKAFVIPAGGSLWLGAWEGMLGNQSELVVTFALPDSAGRFGADIAAGASSGSNVSTRAFVDYVPGAANVSVGTAGVPEVAGGATDSLWMKGEDSTMELRIFVDNTFIEAYWAGGRVAMTQVLLQRDAEQWGMSLFSDVDIKVLSVEAYHMASIWVEPAVVRKALEARQGGAS